MSSVWVEYHRKFVPQQGSLSAVGTEMTARGAWTKQDVCTESRLRTEAFVKLLLLEAEQVA